MKTFILFSHIWPFFLSSTTTFRSTPSILLSFFLNIYSNLLYKKLDSVEKMFIKRFISVISEFFYALTVFYFFNNRLSRSWSHSLFLLYCWRYHTSKAFEGHVQFVPNHIYTGWPILLSARLTSEISLLFGCSLRQVFVVV